MCAACLARSHACEEPSPLREFDRRSVGYPPDLVRRLRLQLLRWRRSRESAMNEFGYLESAPWQAGTTTQAVGAAACRLRATSSRWAARTLNSVLVAYAFSSRSSSSAS